MKNIVLIFMVIAFLSCKSVESQQTVSSNANAESSAAKDAQTPKIQISLPALTEKQQKILDEEIPPKVREILDKSDEINIYYNINKETKQLGVLMFKTVPNAGAKISDATLKKRFLDNFYNDVALSDGSAACFSPRHKITAKYNDKTVEIDVCYQCKNFQGKSSFGNFGGGLAYEDKSSAIINEIIEKYGTDLQ